MSPGFAGLEIAYVTAGGAGMFCGSCMRDNALAAEVQRRGVPITLLPTFTPIRVDEPDHSEPQVFLGGINVYLEQRLPLLGRLPRVLRRALDHPVLLRGLSKLALQTRSEEDARLALSLLQGTSGRQAAETLDLVGFLADELQPNVVALTNLLIAGFVPTLKERSDARVSVTLQGDDIFLDTLRPKERDEVIAAMRSIVPEINVFVTFSEDYRARMSELFEIPLDRIRVVPLGLADAEAFAPNGASRASEMPIDEVRAPTVGYLARICPEKGFHLLVDAFLALRQMPGTESARLRFGGWLGPGDRAFFAEQRERLARGAGEDSFEHVELPDRASKIGLLHSVDVLSVPTVYQECKGLFVLEALAAGVPVVQPDHGCFPELLASTGGGELFVPNDTQQLASVLHRMLLERSRCQELGARGRRGVLARHRVEHMAEGTLQVWAELA